MSRLTAESRRDKRFEREFRRVRRAQERQPKIDITEDLKTLPTYMSPVAINSEFQSKLKTGYLQRAKLLLNRLYGAFGKRAS